MTPDHYDRLRFFLSRVIEMARDYTGTPTSVIDARKKPVDFSFMDIHQYGGTMFTRTYDSYSQLLDDFYTQRDNIQRMRHRSADLLKTLANTADRIARKLSLQEKELADCSDRETWKIYGDLINTGTERAEVLRGISQSRYRRKETARADRRGSAGSRLYRLGL